MPTAGAHRARRPPRPQLGTRAARVSAAARASSSANIANMTPSSRCGIQSRAPLTLVARCAACAEFGLRASGERAVRAARPRGGGRARTFARLLGAGALEVCPESIALGGQVDGEGDELIVAACVAGRG